MSSQGKRFAADTAFTDQAPEANTADVLASVRESHSHSELNGLTSFQTRLEDHNICFVVPAGAMIDGANVRLPGGILVLGAMRGKVSCATGSAIIAEGGEFQGQLEANDILVEGRITSPVDANGKPIRTSLSEIRARGLANAISGEVLGGIVMLSSLAVVCARMHARAYQIPRNANVIGSIMETLIERRGTVAPSN